MLFRQKSVLRSVVHNFKPHTSSNLLILLASQQQRNKSLLPISSSSIPSKKNVRNNTILAKTPQTNEAAEAAAAEYSIQNVKEGPASPAQQTPPSPIHVSVGYEAPTSTTTQASQTTTTVTSDEIEVKDASIIFQQVIKSLEEKIGRENLAFPKEIYFLVGAPGSGKGTMTKHIMHERGLTAGPIVASDLLNAPEMRALKDKGVLVSDKTVIELILKKLLEPQFVNGVVVDGFPRTTVQAECISMLYDFMHQLRKEFISTDLGENFRRPVFRITVLFVDEKVSIDRQLKRGEKIREQNKMARETGVDISYGEERATDVSVEAAKKRYQYFKEHIYQSLKVLKQKFPYNLIDASGPIQVVAQNLIEEFQYQSSMELGKETFDALSAVPPVEELTLHARQQLVRRLDNYLLRNEELFTQVLHIIEKEFLHIMRRQALTGVAVIRSENEIFSNPAALNMALDIFAERGYQVILDLERKNVPVRVNPTTFEIETKERKLWHFQIQFERPKIRQ